MLSLYLSELRRFRNGAAIYCVASLLILVVLQQLIDLPNAPLGAHGVMVIFYMLSGLCFALYQFGTYRQPSRWVWLQHRPVHRARILAALVLAAVTLMALAVALPLFTVLASQEHFTRHVIDRRHYAGAAYLALSALSAWLAGGYMTLHRSRWAFVVMVLPIVLTMHLATAGTVIGLSLACNALLLFLLYTVFRPNRSTGDDATATIANAVPMQVGFYLALLWGGSMLFQFGQMVAGVYPLSSDHVPRGGLTEARRSYPNEAIQAGLVGSADPRAALWRKGLGRQNTAFVGPMVRQHAVRNLITTEGVVTFNDNENRWTFSHDRMMYRGVNRRTRVDQGWLGAGGATVPFDSQPTVLLDNRKTVHLANAHDLYELMVAGTGLRHLLHLGGREQLGAAAAVLDRRTLLLTNRRVVIQEPAGTQRSTVAEVRLPLPFGDLERVDAAQVADGTLVSFVYGYRQLDGVTAAPQIVYLVDSAGRVQEVARRELAHDFPLLFEHKDWWLSPAIHAVVSLPDMLIDNGTVPDDGASRFAPLLRTRPAQAWFAAIAAALLSGAGALWWTRRARIAPGESLAWYLACLLLGVPALLSLMVLKPREQTKTHTARSAVPSHT